MKSLLAGVVIVLAMLVAGGESPVFALCNGTLWCDTGTGLSYTVGCDASCNWESCMRDDIPSGVVGDCGGDEGCFPAGTEVLVSTQDAVSSGQGDKGERVVKNIEDIQIGDRVVSQDASGRQVVSVVAGLDQPVSTNMCEISFSDGDGLELTDNHAMSTVEGWKAINPEAARAEIPSLSIGQLEEGDGIHRADGTVGEVVSIACWSERQQTYNLKLEGGVNTYFADGYLAHNKGGYESCPCGNSVAVLRLGKASSSISHNVVFIFYREKMTTPQIPKEMTAVVLDAYTGVDALWVEKQPGLYSD